MRKTGSLMPTKSSLVWRSTSRRRLLATRRRRRLATPGRNSASELPASSATYIKRSTSRRRLRGTRRRRRVVTVMRNTNSDGPTKTVSWTWRSTSRRRARRTRRWRGWRRLYATPTRNRLGERRVGPCDRPRGGAHVVPEGGGGYRNLDATPTLLGLQGVVLDTDHF